jgi:hypothetical protein
MPGLETVEQYQRLFTDAAHWKPFVEEVCRHHGLEPSADIRTSPVPGTCPVFIVDEKYVVKFFGRLFNGHTSFAAERDAFYLLAQDTELLIPQLLAEGTLLTDGEWPYLISEWRSGQSVGKLRGGLSREAMTKVAAKTGRIAQRLHALPLHVTKTLKPNWDAFADLLEKENDDWHISALIDFGDAIVGDPLFERTPAGREIPDLESLAHWLWQHRRFPVKTATGNQVDLF